MTGRLIRAAVLTVTALIMLIPAYLLVVNAVKGQDDILHSPFGLPVDRLSLTYLRAALSAPEYSLFRAYLVTAGFAVAVNVISLVVSAPAAYVIARGTRIRHRALLALFLLGLFIPSQVLVLPVIYVLKALGLMGTVAGFLLYESTLTLPVSMFLYVAYIKTLPRDLDEAARVDGAGPIVTFWQVIFPLMRPAVATAVILHTIGVWTDFVNPQIILGPGSSLHTVTTSVYAAIGRYSTDFTDVYPNLLMAVVPVLVFFVILQRNIVAGLTAGATKG